MCCEYFRRKGLANPSFAVPLHGFLKNEAPLGAKTIQ
jgi:hypothetical protein